MVIVTIAGLLTAAILVLCLSLVCEFVVVFLIVFEHIPGYYSHTVKNWELELKIVKISDL